MFGDLCWLFLRPPILCEPVVGAVRTRLDFCHTSHVEVKAFAKFAFQTSVAGLRRALQEQQHWTYRKLNASKATWQVLVS